MSKELVISANRHETRVAVIEDDQPVEVYHQRENEYSLAGSIHKGRVTRVLPGMQSAFVDIGLDRDAFLYVSDFFEDNEEYDKIVTSVEEKVFKQMDRPPQAAAVSASPAPETEEEGAEEPAPAVMAESAPPPPPPGAVSAAPLSEPRRDDGRRNDGRRDEGRRDDGRGRRSRRRRGPRGTGGSGSSSGSGGRGLPDSKYYTPGPRSPEGEATPREVTAGYPAEAAPVEAAGASSEADDFFVLPGESLAKYAGGDETEDAESNEPETSEDESGDFVEPETEAVAEAAVAVEEPADAEEPVAALAPEAHSEPEREAVAEIAAEPSPEPQPELAVAVEMVEIELVAAEPAPSVEEAVIVVEGPLPAVTDAESLLESEESALAAVEEAIEAEASGEEALPPETDFAEPVSGEAGAEETAADEAVAEEGAAQEEGPEPARMPTSLTATLREQGPRFLQHRSSRRMRRRGGGRDGRDNREGGNRESGNREPGSREPGNRESGNRESGNRESGNRESGNRESGNRESGNREAGGRGPQEPREPREQRPIDESRTSSAPRPPQEQRASQPSAAPRADRGGTPSISDLLREGQEIIVQIAKEPLGQKGARITSHIALPGRFLVYMPTVEHIGVSRKIPSDEERARLKRVLQTNRTGIPGGYIVRTAGDGRTEEELRADMMFLYNLWLDMRQKAERRPAPLLIHHDLNVVERVLRDQLTASYKSVWVDNEETYESILRFVQRFQPALVNRVKLYTRSTPIFDEFGITGELEKALRPKVWLKSGGYIVINQTEALVAIDINTGKFVGKSNRLEDTIVKTNTDAIKEIVRQIRLRDLGGIIVVDFIDMDERKNRQKVMQALEEAMRADRAPYKILQFNDFGLVAITRKRVKQSLERTLCMPCPYCEGAGYVKSAQTVVGEILLEANKIAKVVEGKDVMLRVAPDVARLLKSNQNTYLQELEETLGRPVIVKGDPQLHLEKFDLA